MRAHLAAIPFVFDRAIRSETARQIWAGFAFVFALPKTHPERAVIAGALLAVAVIAVEGARVAASIPPPDVPRVTAPPSKDQSRFLPTPIDPALARVIFPQPRKLICDDCPIVPRPVQTISIPKPEEARTGSAPKSKGKPKDKRSDAGAGGMQLASLTPLDNEPPFAESQAPARAATDLKTESIPLRTPFGTAIKTRVSLASISPRILGYLQKVQAECGVVTVISGVRSTGVPGTCHRGGKAVDIQIVDHACAMRYARNWSGGHSTDYLGVQAISRGMPAHFHISDCPREMGARFVHRGSSSTTRYAKARSTKARATRTARRAPQRGQRVRVAAAKPVWTGANFPRN